MWRDPPEYPLDDMIADITRNRMRPALLVITGCESDDLARAIFQRTNVLTIGTNREIRPPEAAKMVRLLLAELPKEQSIQAAVNAVNEQSQTLLPQVTLEIERPKMILHADIKRRQMTFRELVGPKQKDTGIPVDDK